MQDFDLLGATARHVREQFIMRRCLMDSKYRLHPKWDGGLDSRGRRQENHWHLAARFFLLNELSVPDCLAIRMASADHKHAVWPNALTPDWILADYRRVSREAGENLQSVLSAEKTACRVAIEDAQDLLDIRGVLAWSHVLADESLQLSPLFRFCLAVSENLDDLALRYREAAVLQYARAWRAYDATWQPCLPRMLTRHVSRVVGDLQESSGWRRTRSEDRDFEP